METFVCGKATIQYNVNEEGWVTDYSVAINETLCEWEQETVVKQKAVSRFFTVRENFTEEVLINLLNDLNTSCGLNTYVIHKAICIHKRSFDFIKNTYINFKSRSSYESWEFLKNYMRLGNIHQEFLSEFKDDIISNISDLVVDKETFYKYIIPFLNENIDRFNDDGCDCSYNTKLKIFLNRNMKNFDFDYDEIKSLLPQVGDDNLIFLTNNMPKTIANDVLKKHIEDTTNVNINRYIYSAYFEKNSDSRYILNNIDDIVKVCEFNYMKDLSLVFEQFAIQSDEVFKKLFFSYKYNQMYNNERISDIVVYERYINLIGYNNILLEDIKSVFDDTIFECHKRIYKIEGMYRKEIDCIKNMEIEATSNIFSIENRQNILDSITSSLQSVKQSLKIDRDECIDILKHEQDYFFIDKKIKTYEFNKCKLSSQKFQEDINVFYTENNSDEKNSSLKEFLEKLLNIKINSKKKSPIPKNIVEEFVECVFRGKITNNKDLSYTLKIDIDLSKEDLLEYMLDYKISADNKKHLSTKTLQDFLQLKE